jgi:(p)ppGpp synthase/HD superfamily hydrolase
MHNIFNKDTSPEDIAIIVKTMAAASSLYNSKNYIADVVAILGHLNSRNIVQIQSTLLYNICDNSSFNLNDIEAEFGKDVTEVIRLINRDHLLSFDDDIDRILAANVAETTKVDAVTVKLAILKHQDHVNEDIMSEDEFLKYISTTIGGQSRLMVYKTNMYLLELNKFMIEVKKSY